MVSLVVTFWTLSPWRLVWLNRPPGGIVWLEVFVFATATLVILEAVIETSLKSILIGVVDLIVDGAVRFDRLLFRI